VIAVLTQIGELAIGYMLFRSNFKSQARDPEGDVRRGRATGRVSIGLR
jgi:hypothetical protein